MAQSRFTESITREPGTYKRTAGGGATLQCPKCKGGIAVGYGATVHQIKPDGMVLPSVVCPRPTCTYHEFVTLEGWS
jgi:hypothetical protein